MMACRVGLGLVFFAFTSKDYRESKKKEEGMGNGDCCFKVKTIERRKTKTSKLPTVEACDGALEHVRMIINS